jgi:hypothetical protein
VAVPDILLDQARSQLARQEAALNTIRNQAIAVYSASGVVAALFVPHLSTQTRPAVIVAAALFVLGTYALIQTVRTREGFAFGLRLPGWLKWWHDHKDDDFPELAAARGIADQLDQLRDGNRAKLRTVADWHNRLCIAFGLQVIAWIAASLIH